MFVENRKIDNVILSLIAIIVNTEKIKDFRNFIEKTKYNLITCNIAIRQNSINKIKSKTIPIFVFVLLTSSLIANVDASLPSGVSGNDGQITDQPKLIKTESHKHFQVGVDENVGISENNGNPQNDQIIPTQTSSKDKNVSIHETLSFVTNLTDQNTVFVVAQQPQVSTTPERISNVVKIRYNGKTMFVDDNSWDHSSTVNLDDLAQNVKSHTNNWNENNPLIGVEKLIQAPSYKNIVSISEVYSVGNDVFYPILQSIAGNANKLAHDIGNTQNPTILLLLVPLSGHILARAEGAQLEFFRTKQFLSFCLLVILVSSIMVAPLSISPTYLSAVYAEEMNHTQSQNSPTNSSNISNPPNTISQSTALDQVSNATRNLPLNEGAKNFTTTNTIILPPLTNLTNSLKNSTHTTPTFNTPVKTSLSDSMLLNDMVSVKGNYTSNTTTNSTQKLPTALQSWNFNSTAKLVTVGNAQLQKQENMTALQLNGKGYLKQNGDSTRNLSALSISAWIKPDYSQGSPQFTVISKENTFLLAVNNNLPPVNKAVFSIFDGIRWNTVISNSTIPEEWTHLAATFNGTAISLYVNGRIDSTVPLPGVLTVAVNGQLATKTVNNLSSNADIVIGTYFDSVRGTPTNSFSGSIANVNLYNSTLTTPQIVHAYDTALGPQSSINILENSTISTNSTHIPSVTATKSTAISESISLADAVSILTNANNQNSIVHTVPANVTIAPQLTVTQKSYLLTQTPQLEFQYVNDSSILKNAQQEVKNDLTTINSAEQNLNKTEVMINSTATTVTPQTIVQINQTQTQINQAQQQINITQGQLLQAQQTIAAAEKSNSPQQMQDALNQTVAATQDVTHVAAALNSTVDQIKQTARVVDTKNLTSSAQTIATVGATIGNMIQSQTGKWSDSNKTILVQTVGPSGNVISIQPTIQKVVDGKFDITLNSTRSITPGLYTIKATLIQDGKTYTAQDQFTWGLVSFNTNKSIYRPGEIANFTLVVLDDGGHSVCNANIAMNIADPQNHITTLTTGNGITKGSSCGLYNGQYATSSEGNYTVNVSAQNPSGIATFSSSFLVQSQYAFDIIRTADSKIDPVDNPNSFNVRIDVQSFVNQTSLTLKETVPASFNVKTDGSVQTVGDTKTIIWYKNLIGNKTSVQYTYSVPLQYPKLYALGPVQITYGKGKSFTEARPWFVAVDPQPYVAITLTNSQISATPVPFQQSIVFNPSNYQNLEAANLGNIRFCADSGCNTQLYSWLENCSPSSCTNTATSATVWVQLTSAIAANGGTQTIYMIFKPTSTNFDQNFWGRAAWIGGGTYGQYDNGRRVFTLYDNFSGTTLNSTKWVSTTSAGGTVTVNNGVTFTTTAATDWAFIVSSTQFSVASNTYVAEVNMTSESNTGIDPMMGVATSTSVNGFVAPDSGYTLDNVANPTATLSLVAESTSTGTTVSSTAVNFNPGIWNSTWTATGAESGSDGVNLLSGVDSTITLANYGILVGQSNVGIGSNSAQMARMRAEPPNGVMPSTSLGGVNYSPVQSETVTATDALSASKGASKTLSETLTFSDSVSASKKASSSITESPTFSDSVSAKKARSSSITESPTFSDSVSATRTLARSVTESPSFSDSPTAKSVLARSITETLTFSDSVSASKKASSSITESTSLVESAAGVANLASTQQIIPPTQTSVIIQSSKPQLVVTSSNAQLSTVTIPSTVTSTSIDYSRITIGGTSSISNAIIITKDTNDGSVAGVIVTIPATTISGTSWDGVLQLPTVRSTSSVTAPAPSGTTSTVQFAFDLGSSTPLTFGKAVKEVYPGQAGKHVGFYHDPNAVMTEITQTCPSVDSEPANTAFLSSTKGACKIDNGQDLVVWTMHFSGFGGWSSSSSGTGTGTGTGTGAGEGAGVVGVGPSGPSSTSAQVFGETLTPYLTIEKVSYDTCNTKMVKIVVATDNNSTTNLRVILRTSLTGVIDAQLSKDQSYAEQNVNATIQRLVYEAPIDPNEKSFEVLALEQIGNNVYSQGQTIEVNGCQGITYFTNEQVPEQQIPIDLSTPKIFDVKFMVGNSTKVSSSDITSQYVNGQSLTVSAIISSPTPISRGELRYVTVGQSPDSYAAVAMGVSPLPISNSTYIITGTIPAQSLQAPAIQYWVHVENNAAKTSDSNRYSIGVKPNYPVVGNLELDVTQNKAAGTIARPTAYFNASGNPVFGTVSLVVDGNKVYTSPPQLFTSRQTAVDLEWKTQPTDQLVNHQIQAIANIYDSTFATNATITIFPSVKTMSILQPIQIDTITDKNGHTIANPVVLYSSFKNDGTMMFKVTAPDGTCVIGSANDCLVTSSTFGLHGQLKSITISDQVYRVRYSGADSSLERFSITSVDPIVGKWSVEIDSTTDLLPQAQAMGDAFLKVKYQAVIIPFMPQGN